MVHVMSSARAEQGRDGAPHAEGPCLAQGDWPQCRRWAPAMRGVACAKLVGKLSRDANADESELPSRGPEPRSTLRTCSSEVDVLDAEMKETEPLDIQILG